MGNQKHKLIKTKKVARAAKDLMHEGQVMTDDLYREGMYRIKKTQKNLSKYSGTVLNKIKQNPLTSVLIASGVGFILSALLRR